MAINNWKLFLVAIMWLWLLMPIFLAGKAKKNKTIKSIPSISESIVSNNQKELQSIIFKPNSLEITESYVCIPTVHEINIINTYHEDIELYSMVFSLNDSSLQCNQFTTYSIIIKPKEEFIINIIHLPQITHHIMTEGILNTSIGLFTYPITIISYNNLYNINSIHKNQLFAGSLNETIINIYNPHNNTLTITEIFTTNDFLVLKELKTINKNEKNEKNNENTLILTENFWDIPSNSHQSVIILSYRIVLPQIYEGYVHIKTNYHNFVIPVTIDVIEGNY